MRQGIIGAGNWIIDKLKQLDRWPGEGNLASIVSETSSTGGGPANVLFDLVAADPEIPLYAAGRIGNDAEGRFLLEEIRKRGIDTHFMTVSPTASTSYTDVMGADGRRTFFHKRGANAELAPEHLSGIDVPAKYFYLGYLLLLDKLDAPAPEGGTEAVKLLRSMRGKGMKTIVDFVSDAPERFRTVVLPALPEIDILIVNEVEASCCSGIELRKADGSMEWKNLPAALEFLFAHGVQETAVIHFPEGAIGGFKGQRPVYSPSCFIPKEEIVGSTGAGDAFCAGVIYALYRDWSMEKALRIGSAFSNFNLRSASATGGAVPLRKMEQFLENCTFRDDCKVAFL